MRNSVIFRSALICGVLAVAGYMYVMARASLALDREGSAFAQNTVIGIGAHWDPAELWRRATPRFREATSQDQLRTQFDAANVRTRSHGGPAGERRQLLIASPRRRRALGHFGRVQ